MKKIRVLVVEDSLVFRQLLVQNLNKDPAIEVVATANDPYEARDLIISHHPDVMTLDIELPRMSGLEFLRKLMPQYPMPVVMISTLSEKVFDAMQAGAVDFVAKPQTTDKKQLEFFLANELPVKIKIASTASLANIKKRVASGQRNALANASRPVTASSEKIVAIGASTGGTEAIANVISEFGTDIPGVVIVQHMPAGFTQMYAQRLNERCKVFVKEAQNGDRVEKGTVLLAPGGDAHMRVVKVAGGYQVEIKKGERVNGHCPSVEVLFDSVATAAGANAVGVILTGMGGDGAKGLLKMRQAGAQTIGQDESTCVVYGMPKVAYECGAVQYQERLENIAAKVYSVLRRE